MKLRACSVLTSRIQNQIVVLMFSLGFLVGCDRPEADSDTYAGNESVDSTSVKVALFKMSFAEGPNVGSEFGVIRQELGGSRFRCEVGCQYFEKDSSLCRSPPKVIAGFDGMQYWMAFFKDSFESHVRDSTTACVVLKWHKTATNKLKLPDDIKEIVGFHSDTNSLCREMFFLQRVQSALLPNNGKPSFISFKNSPFVDKWENIPTSLRMDKHTILQSEHSIFLDNNEDRFWLSLSKVNPYPVQEFRVIFRLDTVFGGGDRPKKIMPRYFRAVQLKDELSGNITFSPNSLVDSNTVILHLRQGPRNIGSPVL